MVDRVLHLKVPSLHRLADVDLEQVTAVLAEGIREREARPEFSGVLEQFPPLHASYLKLDVREREKVADFYHSTPSYFIGHGAGDVIRSLDLAAKKETRRLARTCRYVHQLLTLYALHQEHTPEKPFTTHYLRTDQTLRSWHHSAGANLVANLRNAEIPLAEIVMAAAYVEPSLTRSYDSREKQEERREKVYVLPA